MAEKRDFKTVAVSSDTAKRIDHLASVYELSKKDFLEKMVSYFEKNGVDPSKHESPKSELETLKKRVEDVLKFIRKQESDIQRPMLVEIKNTSEYINQKLTSLATLERVENLEKSLEKMKEANLEMVKVATTAIQKVQEKEAQETALSQKLDALISTLAEKEQDSIKGKISNFFG